MSKFEDRLQELADYIATHDMSTTPEYVGGMLADALQEVPEYLRGEQRSAALREKTDAVVWFKNKAAMLGLEWEDGVRIQPELLKKGNSWIVIATVDSGRHIIFSSGEEVRDVSVAQQYIDSAWPQTTHVTVVASVPADSYPYWGG